ncbi:MAG TPA: L,D-transpeptidase [Kofleriaceae bacterium]|nr:L,D-transpeptidase [Kofleriaceae bacterium]
MSVRTISALLGLSALAGCGQKAADSPPPGPAQGSNRAAMVPTNRPAPSPPLFPPTTKSLRLSKTVSVRLEPTDDAKRIGTVAIDTRVAWTDTRAGTGCSKPWVKIEPMGWVCAEFLRPETKPPHGQEVPYLDRDEVVPGVYGKVVAAGAMMYEYDDPTKPKPKSKKDKKAKDKKAKDAKAKDVPVMAPSEVDAAEQDDPTKPHMVPLKPVVGSMNVRKYGEITVAGKQYWKISDKNNEYVLRSSISQHSPSNFIGSRFGDDLGTNAPLGFVWPRSGGLYVWARRKAVGGGVTRQLMKKTAVGIFETVNDAAGKPTAYRIGDEEWVDASALRVFAPAALPRGLTPNERWIDVDLDTQILVAFEGSQAVYATLVSTGGRETPTETGVYRMWKKVSETDMNGLNGEDPYSVATVPWTQFFSPETGLAIHTAYWHNDFGIVRSHGCVNVAPQDARWLYFWSDPQTPPGWSMSAGVVEQPGSIVRVRSAKDPDPPERGYAKKVLETRQAAR